VTRFLRIWRSSFKKMPRRLKVTKEMLEGIAKSTGIDMGVDLSVYVSKFLVELYAHIDDDIKIICSFNNPQEARRALLAMSTISFYKYESERKRTKAVAQSLDEVRAQ
jgi:hypothetical protein